MAARLNLRHSNMVREKIRTSQLINLLQNHALDDEGKEIADSRRDSAKFLIGMALSKPPQEISGPDGGAIPIEATVTFVGSTKAT